MMNIATTTDFDFAQLAGILSNNSLTVMATNLKDSDHREAKLTRTTDVLIRQERRVALKLTLYIRRTINSNYYQRIVQTENVSRQGARIICDRKLEVGAELEITGLRNQFSGKGVVTYVEQREDGRWAMGIKFTEKNGNWVVF